MEHRYAPQEIEPRWQRVWAEEKTWEVDNAVLDDPSVEELWINEPGRVFVARGGR